MRKNFVIASAMSIMLVSCGTMGTTQTGNASSGNNGSVLGGILSSMGNGETIGNILTSVIGMDKLTTSTITGTWKYDGPGCAFTSDNALAKGGGEVAASKIEDNLKTYYDKLGLASSNTYITLNSDGTFSSKINGKSFSGKWTFDEDASLLTLKGTLLTINGYAKRNTNGISILFEATKLLSLMQTMAAISGNSTLQGIGELSKNYDGLRIGFDMKK